MLRRAREAEALRQQLQGLTAQQLQDFVGGMEPLGPAGGGDSMAQQLLAATLLEKANQVGVLPVQPPCTHPAAQQILLHSSVPTALLGLLACSRTASQDPCPDRLVPWPLPQVREAVMQMALAAQQQQLRDQGEDGEAGFLSCEENGSEPGSGRTYWASPRAPGSARWQERCGSPGSDASRPDQHEGTAAGSPRVRRRRLFGAEPPACAAPQTCSKARAAQGHPAEQRASTALQVGARSASSSPSKRLQALSPAGLAGLSPMQSPGYASDTSSGTDCDSAGSRQQRAARRGRASRVAGSQRRASTQGPGSRTPGEEQQGGTPQVYVYPKHRLGKPDAESQQLQQRVLVRELLQQRSRPPSRPGSPHRAAPATQQGYADSVLQGFAQQVLAQTPQAAAAFTPNTVAALATMEQALGFIRTFNQEHGPQFRSRSALSTPAARSPARQVAPAKCLAALLKPVLHVLPARCAAIA